MRIALALKNLQWKSLPVSLVLKEHQQDKYLQQNPQGMVPTLVTDKTSIHQSLAIIEYLEEQYPEPPLLPSSASNRAVVRALSQIIACDIHPLNNLRVTQFLTEVLCLSVSQKLDWYHHWITEGFSALETKLEKLGSNGRYCFGSTPTLADICLIPQVYNAQRFDCPMDKYPLINGIWAHCMSKPEFIQASPETQPDHPANL